MISSLYSVPALQPGAGGGVVGLRGTRAILVAHRLYKQNFCLKIFYHIFIELKNGANIFQVRKKHLSFSVMNRKINWKLNF